MKFYRKSFKSLRIQFGNCFASFNKFKINDIRVHDKKEEKNKKKKKHGTYKEIEFLALPFRKFLTKIKIKFSANLNF